MIKTSKKEWIEGLILMAINSTIAKDKREQRKYALDISDTISNFIIEQFDDDKDLEKSI